MLGAMGKPDRIVHVGDSGAGQICKACNQIVLGGTMAVVAEAIALSRKAGVDPMKVRAALMGGFAQSRVLEVHGERMITGNWKPGFKAKLFNKDLGIAMNTLARTSVPAPASAVVQQLVRAQMAAGEGEEDYSGIAKVIFKLADSGDRLASRPPHAFAWALNQLVNERARFSSGRWSSESFAIATTWR